MRAVRGLERTQQRLQLATEMANLQVYDVDYQRRTITSAGKALFPDEGGGTRAGLAEAVFSEGTDRLHRPRATASGSPRPRAAFHKDGALYDL